MHTITQALVTAIRLDGRTLYELGQTGLVDKGQLSRFLRGRRSFTLPVADRVCEALGVECRLVRRRSKKGGGR